MKTDYNSSENQKIKGEFVGREVHANVNSMVEYILAQDDYTNAPFTFEDIDNNYSYPEYYGKFASFAGGTETERATEIERLQSLLQEENDKEQTDSSMSNISIIESEIEDLISIENEPQEVFEWWIVSSFLCEKLSKLGHPVIKDQNIWGRCTTGQAILLDYAISQICEDLEILEGQKNQW
jgi:hypothetical protein